MYLKELEKPGLIRNTVSRNDVGTYSVIEKSIFKIKEMLLNKKDVK